MPEGRLVYSTDGGDRRRDAPSREAPVSDGVVRVVRETSGRRGKGVTVVRGLPAADVARVATELKKLCGAGGTVKDGAVEIQGDHRDAVAAKLRAAGYAVE